MRAAFDKLLPLWQRLQDLAGQARHKLQPSAKMAAPTPQQVALAERQAASTQLLASKVPEWYEKEGQDWVARNYYRIYLAFAEEVTPGTDLHALLSPTAGSPLSEDNQALVQAYKNLMAAAQADARRPVEERLDAWRVVGLKRINPIFAAAAGLVALQLLGVCVLLWRSNGLPLAVKVVLSLLLWGGALAGAWKLWQGRGRFNPNRQAMAELQARYDELETASLQRIRDHAKDAALELYYAVMSGKSWVFSRLSNEWATEKYVFLGDAFYEAACITEVTDTLRAQAQYLAQGLPVVIKPIENLLDFSAPQLGLGTQCPRCRTAFETGDHFCMACGLRLTAVTRPEAVAV